MEAITKPETNNPPAPPAPTPEPPPAATIVLDSPKELTPPAEPIREEGKQDEGDVAKLRAELKEAQTKAAYAENRAQALKEQMEAIGGRPAKRKPEKKTGGFGFFRHETED